MNIQIFGKSKCFDTKKAERYFKERRIPYQMIDLKRYGMSGREFDSVLKALGGIDKLIDWEGKNQQITNMKYMADDRTKEDKVFDDPMLMKTPVVRNGKQATVGYCPEIWAEWKKGIYESSPIQGLLFCIEMKFFKSNLAVLGKSWYSKGVLSRKDFCFYGISSGGRL